LNPAIEYRNRNQPRPFRNVQAFVTRRRRHFLVLASAWLFLLAIGAVCASAASYDERYLEGLRQRRLYELAEAYCDERLADPSLDDPRRSALTVELVRSLSEHALEAGGDIAAGLWKRAAASVAEYAAQHPNDPRLVIVRLQGALAHAAEGESLRLSLGDATDPQATSAVRDAHRRAIADFEQLERQVAGMLRRTSRPGPSDGGLNAAELQSVLVNLQYQLAKTLISQAQSYPVSSADRINALSRAGESLQRIVRQKSRTALVWSAALEELARLRLLGEYSTAESQLAELAASRPPEAVASRLQAERIRLALARQRLDEALAEAGTAANAKQGPDIDLARLETQLAAWRRATSQHLDDEATEWQRRATEQAAMIGRTYGGQWMRQAEGLVAATLQGSGFRQSANTVALTAAGFYRSGQLDKAIAAFDQAARAARDERQAERAFDAAYSAATIEKERQNFRAASDRYRQLALDSPQHPRAAAVHLLAAYCAAQLAQLEKPPKLDEYRNLLREHILTWPQGKTASQACSWLGRLAENRGDWNEAIETLSQVKPGDPQYTEAAAAISRCYEAKLAEAHVRGENSGRLADDALAALERISASARTRGGKPDAATRAATLSAARIWLTEISTGALPAERLLQDALKSDTAAPADWQASARRWLVPALVMQNKGGQADQMLDAVTKSPADALASLEVLSLVRRRQVGSDGARKLAGVELRLAQQLLERSAELDGQMLRSVQRRRAITLAESGQRQEGLAALQALADEYPRDGQAHEDLANLLMAGNDTDLHAALTKWTQVAEKSRPGTPRFFRAYCGLAQTQLKLGQRRAAAATVQAVADKYPQLGGVAMKPRFEQILAEAK
jgi:tetratricopeptide (TPR) repeat protein